MDDTENGAEVQTKTEGTPNVTSGAYAPAGSATAAAALNTEINQPPEPVPVQHAAASIFGNLFGAVEHLIGGLAHLQAVVPAAAGLGMVVTAARMRLEAAKTALADAALAITDAEHGDYSGAIASGEAGYEAGKEAVEGPQHEHS